MANLKLKHPDKFERAKSRLKPKHKALVEKAGAAFASGGARGLIKQTIANGHEMLNDLDKAVDAAPDDAALEKVMDEGVAQFKEAIDFITSEDAALEGFPSEG